MMATQQKSDFLIKASLESDFPTSRIKLHYGKESKLKRIIIFNKILEEFDLEERTGELGENVRFMRTWAMSLQGDMLYDAANYALIVLAEFDRFNDGRLIRGFLREIEAMSYFRVTQDLIDAGKIKARFIQNYNTPHKSMKLHWERKDDDFNEEALRNAGKLYATWMMSQFFNKDVDMTTISNKKLIEFIQVCMWACIQKMPNAALGLWFADMCMKVISDEDVEKCLN